MNKELLEFLIAWREWAKDPYKKGNGTLFDTRDGLCGAAYDWCVRHNKEKVNELSSTFLLERELINLFREENLNPTFPFGEQDYGSRVMEQTQHLCLVRLAWVDKTIKEIQEVVDSEKS